MKVSVDAKALYQVLQALNGPDHYICELQAIRSLPTLPGERENPINQLIREFNEAGIPADALK